MAVLSLRHCVSNDCSVTSMFVPYHPESAAGALFPAQGGGEISEGYKFMENDCSAGAKQFPPVPSVDLNLTFLIQTLKRIST